MKICKTRAISLFSTLFIFSTTIISLIVYQSSVPLIALSDLGYHPTTAAIFNIGIIAKGVLDLMWWRIIVKKNNFFNNNKIKFMIIMWTFSFVSLALLNSSKFNLIHWFFAFTFFALVLYTQKLVAKIYAQSIYGKITMTFIVLEILFASIGLLGTSYYLASEVLVFSIICIWQILISEQLNK